MVSSVRSLCPRCSSPPVLQPDAHLLQLLHCSLHLPLRSEKTSRYRRKLRDSHEEHQEHCIRLANKAPCKPDEELEQLATSTAKRSIHRPTWFIQWDARYISVDWIGWVVKYGCEQEQGQIRSIMMLQRDLGQFVQYHILHSIHRHLGYTQLQPTCTRPLNPLLHLQPMQSTSSLAHCPCTTPADTSNNIRVQNICTLANKIELKPSAPAENGI